MIIADTVDMEVKKKTFLEESYGRIFEAQKSDQGKKTYPVVIISQGLGNLVDKNYYTAAAVESGVAVYEGRKAYTDHPTPYEAQQRPLRSVNETVGHYENCRAEKDANGLMLLKADFVPEAGTNIEAKLDHAIEFKKKYPDKDYIGISINGDGEGASMEYGQFLSNYKPSAIEMEKISQVAGEYINVITKLTDAISADLVTSAGAKGRILTESQKINKTRRAKMLEAFRKLFSGIEKKDAKITEEAVKAIMDENATVEAAKPNLKEMSAEGLSKHYMAAKKELVKQESDTEEGFESKCMASAMDKYKKEMDAKPKEDKDAAADKADPANDKDAKDDMEKMKQENEKLKADNAKLLQEKTAQADTEKKLAEDAANAKIELQAKKRSDFIDKCLAESGLPRAVTKEIRGVVEKCKTEDEIKETVKRMSEAATKAIEENFYSHASKGFPEKTVEGDGTSNDHLF